MGFYELVLTTVVWLVVAIVFFFNVRRAQRLDNKNRQELRDGIESPSSRPDDGFRFGVCGGVFENAATRTDNLKRNCRRNDDGQFDHDAC